MYINIHDRELSVNLQSELAELYSRILSLSADPL